MHIQARASKPLSLMTDDDDHGDGGVAASARYAPGTLSELLAVLEEGGFNVRAAGGHDIELGGEFSFWVDQRLDDAGNPIDANEHAAIGAAAEFLREADFHVQLVEVHSANLPDAKGALRNLVDAVRDKGYLVKEISVGTADPDTGLIPVQVFTVEVG